MRAHLTFPFRVFGFVVGFAVTLRFSRCRMHATLPRLTATLPYGWNRRWTQDFLRSCCTFVRARLVNNFALPAADENFGLLSG